MAKKRKLLPKRVAGLKVPKRLRKSRLLQEPARQQARPADRRRRAGRGRRRRGDGAAARARAGPRSGRRRTAPGQGEPRPGDRSGGERGRCGDAGRDRCRTRPTPRRGIRRAASAVRPRQPARRGTERGRDPVPEARSGLPRPLERRLMKRYGRHRRRADQAGRGAQGAGVLVRHHPRAALEMLGAGAIQAGRAGVQELTRKLGAYDRPARRNACCPLSRRELRRFRNPRARGRGRLEQIPIIPVRSPRR